MLLAGILYLTNGNEVDNIYITISKRAMEEMQMKFCELVKSIFVLYYGKF